MAIQLREYQERFIAVIRDAIDDGHNAVMAVAPTGAGKTICFSYMAEAALQKGKSTYILVHRKELVKQTSKSLTENGIPHGVIAAGYPIRDNLIQVCSIQSMARRLHLIKPPDLLVNDETHHICAKSYLPVLDWARNSQLLGVTATPCRSDRQGFTKYFSIMVLCDDLVKLMHDKWLSRPIFLAPPIKGIDLSNVHSLGGDFQRDELNEAMDKPTITGDAVEHYKRLCPDHPLTIVFCVSVDHAKHVAADFRANWIPAGHIDGSMSEEEREAVVMAFANGEIRVLTSCDLISEGFDLSAIAGRSVSVACAILLRPTKSLAVLLQQIGRALRPSASKTQTLILDHVDNLKRHVEDIVRIFGLGENPEPMDWVPYFEGQNKRKKSARGETLATCPKCYAVFPPLPICPNCGHNLKVATNGPGREIEQTDGELVPLDASLLLSSRAVQQRVKSVVYKLERIK